MKQTTLHGKILGEQITKKMDRKAKIREYKETPRLMGVYQIKNRVNGKVLIGSSVNLPAILNRYKSELKTGGCRNAALQNEWNESGPWLSLLNPGV